MGTRLRQRLIGSLAARYSQRSYLRDLEADIDQKHIEAYKEGEAKGSVTEEG